MSKRAYDHFVIDTIASVSYNGNNRLSHLYASLAQSGEHYTVTVEVRGSKPLRGAKTMKLFNCKFCNKENKVRYSGSDKSIFCDKECAQNSRVREKMDIEPSLRTAKSYMKRFVEYKCAGLGEPCGIHEWNGKPLVLQLDHIDGDNKNHRKDNLRWLCPNCHTQTTTWGSKNVSPEGKKRILEALKR